ncbi:hypothetical protein HDV62DRAFT_343598 [Trichoderma sp. SZMC 28011]
MITLYDEFLLGSMPRLHHTKWNGYFFVFFFFFFLSLSFSSLYAFTSGCIRLYPFFCISIIYNTLHLFLYPLCLPTDFTIIQQ